MIDFEVKHSQCGGHFTETVTFHSKYHKNDSNMRIAQKAIYQCFYKLVNKNNSLREVFHLTMKRFARVEVGLYIEYAIFQISKQNSFDINAAESHHINFFFQKNICV